MSDMVQGLDKNILDGITRIIAGYKKVERIVLYGSRATASFKKTSDIDIAIFGQDWTSRDINLVKSDLEEYVQTPLKFDVVLFDKLEKENLKADILDEGVTIYESKED